MVRLTPSLNPENAVCNVHFNSKMVRLTQLNRKLLPNANNLEIRFNMDALMRGDMNARSDYYNRLFQIAAISPNEIRKAEGLPMYPGGSSYYRPLNMDVVGNQSGNDKSKEDV